MSSPDKFHQFASTSTVRGDLKNRSVLGVFSTAVGSGLDFILRLVSISVLAHLVIPEHFGLVGMVTAVTAIGSQIVHLGLGTATIQRPEIDHRQVSTLFWINVAFGLVLALILAAAAPWLARFYQDTRLIPITIAIASSFFWSGLSVQHEALLTRQMQQGAIAVVRVGAMLGSAGLAVGLALADYGFWALVWQEVSRAALLTFGFWYFCRWVPGWPSRAAGIGTFLSFGWHMTLTQLLNAFVLNLDRVLLGRFFGAEPVGLYGRAQQLILAPVEQLNAPIQSVAQPALSLLQSDPERFRRYFRKIVLIIGLATMPFAVAGGVYAHEATYLVLGPEWDHAAILFLIFAFWAFIRPVLGMAGVVLISLGRSKRLLNYSYVRQVVFIALTLVGLKWGMVGVAVAQVGSTYLLLIPCLLYSFAQAPVSMSDFFRAIRTPALASLLMGGALVALRHAMPEAGMATSLVCGAVCGAFVYGVAILALPGDRQDIIDILRSAVDMALRYSSRPRSQAQLGPSREETPHKRRGSGPGLRLVAPWGFYGMGNTGDEGTVCGFARLLARGGINAQVAMGSGNPRHSARVEPAFRYFAVAGNDPRRWWAKLRGNAQAIVGGTPIMDILGDWPLRDIAPLVTAAARRHLPFVCIGCGTEDLRLDTSLAVFREHIAPHIHHWSVRSSRDQERLIRYGVPAEIITVAADVAWLIEPASPAWGTTHLHRLGLDPQRPFIGVNIANENSCFERHPEMAASLARALDRLIEERDAHVLFMCAEVREDPTFDLAAAKLIRARMSRADHASILPNDYLAPRELMSIIACCELTVSMRYHFCLFSALQQVPFIAIRRADKVSDLCWDLGWPASVVPPAITTEELIAHADTIYRDRSTLARSLHDGREMMMVRAMKNLDALRGLPGMSDLIRR